MKKETEERHKENQESKKLALERWKEETAALHRTEDNKIKLRANRDINIRQYEGPETDRLENRDRVNKS